MATVLEVKRVTSEEISADLEKLVQEEFQMDLPTFFDAVEAKTLCADNDLIREILSWLDSLPKSHSASRRNRSKTAGEYALH